MRSTRAARTRWRPQAQRLSRSRAQRVASTYFVPSGAGSLEMSDLSRSATHLIYDSMMRIAPAMCSARPRVFFQPSEAAQCVLTRFAAHLDSRFERNADERPLRTAEQAAAFVLIELNAPNACRLAVRHARNRTGDRRRRATGAASLAALHSRSVRYLRAECQRQASLRSRVASAHHESGSSRSKSPRAKRRWSLSQRFVAALLASRSRRRC